MGKSSFLETIREGINSLPKSLDDIKSVQINRVYLNPLAMFQLKYIAYFSHMSPTRAAKFILIDAIGEEYKKLPKMEGVTLAMNTDEGRA